MTGKTFSLHVPPATLLLLVIMIAAASLGMASPADYTGHAASAAGSMQQPAVDVRATWSGIFFSKHSNVTPFTMTVEPTIKVLKVENPTVSDPNSNQTSNGQVTLTLDVPKQDAEFMVYTMEKGSLYFGLLPPGQVGLQLPAQAISLDRFLGKKQS